MGFFEDREDRGDLGPPPEPFRIGGGGSFRSPIALKWIGLIAGLVVFIVFANVAKSIYVDFLWFDSVGFEDNFRRVIVAQIVLFTIGTALTVVVLGFNIWLARRLTPEGIEESFIEDVDPEAIRRVVTVVLVTLTILIALGFGVAAANHWETVLTWWNAVEFGVEDPAFDQDVSFYLFELPAFHFMQGWLLSLLVVSALGSGAVYGLSFSLQRFELNLTRGMKLHVSILGGLILLTIALGTWLSIFDLATSSSEIVTGATFADINARLPARYLLIALGAFAGLATIANAALNGGWRVPAFSIGLWVVAGIAAGFIYPSFVQSFQVEPNELEKEQKFIARNIEFTRRAWGLDIEDQERDFAAEPFVTEEEIAENAATIANVRLLDARPTRDTFNQIQSIRPLYQFDDVDVDRYTIDGVPQQVMLAARELDLRRARQTGSGWTQQRLQFTHGFGAVVAPVNDHTAEGLPVLLTRDIPPIGEEVPISLDGARIYFGELTNHYVIVKSKEPEFDFPVGDSIAETHYEPDRGIKLSSFFRRFALFWELGDRNLLISERITSDSRLLMHRALDDRIQKVAPFLELDPDPYLVVIDERLIWIQDAYTTSGNFPYSQHLGGTNYIRNSVKVVVDAETGDMTFYLMDTRDPIAATWAKIFPDLFTPEKEMDERHPGVREHLRYPEGMFLRQAIQYLKYHITDPKVFFQQEDLWAIPTEKFRQQEQPLEPYYVIMKLPGEESEEFSLIMPFTPRNKQNTIAWLAGRSDGEFLGTLRAYRFPTDDLVFGPAQIEARIDQNPAISAQFSLWDTSGSEVIRGNLLMIPIGESFLFVEPIYLQAESSRIPELKRIVVANGNNIAMEPTFQRALDVVFGRQASSLPGADTTAPPPITTPGDGGDGGDGGTVIPSGDLEALLDQAREASQAAQAELDELNRILREIAALDE